jgi:hypothetical protein
MTGRSKQILGQMLQECAWESFHIWGRMHRGVFPKGTLEATAGVYLPARPNNSSIRPPA